jgi:hypothetical protein
VWYSRANKQIKTDADYVSEMDIQWLLNNGWTVAGNLAYRKLLAGGLPCSERIEQLILQYELPDTQVQKIKEALQELIDLRNLIQG